MASDLMLERIMDQVIPHVIAGIQDAGAAYSATATADGDNFSDSRIYGLACYWLIQNRLVDLLPEDSGFKILRNKNILRLVWNDGFRDFVFLILKVGKDTRFFTGAKSVKAELQQQARQCQLMPEMEKYDIAPNGYVNNLGYDASCANGLGAITLDRIRHKGGDEFEVETIYEFALSDESGEKVESLNPKSPEPEKIKRHSLVFNPPHCEDEADLKA